MGVQGQAGLDRPRLFDRSWSSFFCLFDFSSLLLSFEENPLARCLDQREPKHKSQNTIITPLWRGRIVNTV
jgi:hypothetical protein